MLSAKDIWPSLKFIVRSKYFTGSYGYEFTHMLITMTMMLGNLILCIHVASGDVRSYILSTTISLTALWTLTISTNMCKRIRQLSEKAFKLTIGNTKVYYRGAHCDTIYVITDGVVKTYTIGETIATEELCLEAYDNTTIYSHDINESKG